jgi:serine/threonine protein kinase
VAPEVIKGEPYGSAVDLWSLGVVLYAMVCGRLPWYCENIGSIQQQILNNQVTSPFHLSDDCRNVIERLLCKDPRERITLDELKQHPFLQGERFVDSSLGSVTGELDEKVVTEMRRYGLGTDRLKEILEQKERIPEAAIYRMLRKTRITGELCAQNAWGRRDKINGSASGGGLLMSLGYPRQKDPIVRPFAPGMTIGPRGKRHRRNTSDLIGKVPAGEIMRRRKRGAGLGLSLLGQKLVFG